MMILYIKLQLNEFRKPNGTRRRNSKSKKEKKNEIKIKEKINKKSALKSFFFYFLYFLVDLYRSDRQWTIISEGNGNAINQKAGIH